MKDPATKYAKDVIAGRIPACRWTRLACERHVRDLDDARFVWRPDRAQQAFDFFGELKHYKGAFAGKPFELEPWEQFVIGSIYGWTRKDTGRRRFRYAYVEVPRKNGKALSLDTPIPTPGGWTTMGEVQVGDTIFDERGDHCVVTYATGVQYDRSCYRVCFSDGTSVVADQNHLWRTDARRKGNGTRGRIRQAEDDVRTTREIADTLRVGNGSRVEWNHSIPVPEPLNLPDAYLPVPAYTLGAWLGDGTSANARLSCADGDVDILDRIAADGVTIKQVTVRDRVPTYLLGSGGRSQAARNRSLAATLRSLGLLGNKHIPAVYLRASRSQRMDLLRGLMDTDGHATKAGQCEFTTTSPALRDGILELLRSLGFKTRSRTERATFCGRDCGEKYRVQFCAFADDSVFHLSRKTMRLQPRPATRTRSQTRQIVSVDPVKSVPVRCIQVSSPSSLFLAGKGMVPTHNTTLASGIGLLGLISEPGAEVYSVATKEDQAKLSWHDGVTFTKKSPMLTEALTLRTKVIKFEQGDGTWKPLGSDSETLDGLNPSTSILDELHAWKDRTLYDVIDDAQGARDEPLMFIITTAGHNQEGVCYETRTHACSVLEGTIPDDSFFGVIYTVDDPDNWQDENEWRKANPNIGVSKSWEYMRDQAARAKDSPSKRNAFLSKQLNIWTSANSAWIPNENWKACAARFSESDLEGERCYGGLDLSQKVDLSAFAMWFPDANRLLVRFWMPEDTLHRRAKEDHVPYHVWADQGWIKVTEGNAVDVDTIEADIRKLLGRYSFEQIGFDPWNATQTSIRLTAEGATMTEVRQGYRSLSEPTKEIERLVFGKDVEHNDNPVMNWMMSNVSIKEDENGNKRPVKPPHKTKVRIDGVVAWIMAQSCALEDDRPEEPPKNPSIRFI